jgi:hypothetical protein
VGVMELPRLCELPGLSNRSVQSAQMRQR